MYRVELRWGRNSDILGEWKREINILVYYLYCCYNYNHSTMHNMMWCIYRERDSLFSFVFSIIQLIVCRKSRAEFYKHTHIHTLHILCNYFTSGGGSLQKMSPHIYWLTIKCPCRIRWKEGEVCAQRMIIGIRSASFVVDFSLCIYNIYICILYSRLCRCDNVLKYNWVIDLGATVKQLYLLFIYFIFPFCG